MELYLFFLKLMVLFVPPLLLLGVSKDFSFMLVGFTIGVVIGIQVDVLATWWITLAVLGIVASVFVKWGGD